MNTGTKRADAPADDGTATSDPARVGPWIPGPSRVLRAVGAQNLALIAALVLLCGIIRIYSDRIFLVTNLLDIAVAVSILGILAVAQMVVIISGGLDISIGSTASLSGVITALALDSGQSTVPAILLGLLTGLAAGAVNGFFITLFSLSPIIVTLATFSAFAGVALRITNGIAIPVINDVFDVVGTESLVGVPYPVWLLVVFAVSSYFYLRMTVVGRHIYAMGSNEAAARNTGIPLARYRFGIYVYAGIAGAVAGLLGVAQSGLGGASSTGADLGLTAITAALLGGAALTGGRGSIVGAILGVFIIGVLENGLVLVGANPFYSQVFIGLLLITAVALQRIDVGGLLARRRRQREAGTR